jgi:hypothetical protein
VSLILEADISKNTSRIVVNTIGPIFEQQPTEINAISTPLLQLLFMTLKQPTLMVMQMKVLLIV